MMQATKPDLLMAKQAMAPPANGRPPGAWRDRAARALIAAVAVLLAASAATATARAAAPAVLDEADVELYAEIFDLQERSRWGEADEKIANLKNRTLLGYVLEQRYMHPTGYRSSYEELRTWLSSYADHPQADDIYSLALKRRPRGASPPVRPVARGWREEADWELPPALIEDYARVGEARVRQIEGRIRYLCKREEATTALKEMDEHLRARRITERQYDRMRSWVSASLYFQGYLATAGEIASEAAARNGDVAVLGYWIKGLVAYREGDLETALDAFGAMASVEHQEDALRSAAGFWAARAALATGALNHVAPNLEIAAARPLTFYGQLALAQLGREHAFDWTPPALADRDFKALAAEHQGALRAVALKQVGRDADADLELRWLNGRAKDTPARTLLALAAALDLPAAQVDIALSENDPALAPGLYPIPSYQPADGFKTDRAVLYALIRQESKFKPDAKSRVGARGLMQVMPRTASYVAKDRDLATSAGRDRLLDPAFNMQIGQMYVNYLLDAIDGGDLFEVATAYNGGPGNLRRWKAQLRIDDPLLFIESIPNSESRDYVEKVLTNIWIYRQRLGQPTPSRERVAAGEEPAYEALDLLIEGAR